jgi:hypothetical protein
MTHSPTVGGRVTWLVRRVRVEYSRPSTFPFPLLSLAVETAADPVFSLILSNSFTEVRSHFLHSTSLTTLTSLPSLTAAPLILLSVSFAPWTVSSSLRTFYTLYFRRGTYALHPRLFSCVVVVVDVVRRATFSLSCRDGLTSSSSDTIFSLLSLSSSSSSCLLLLFCRSFSALFVRAFFAPRRTCGSNYLSQSSASSPSASSPCSLFPRRRRWAKYTSTRHPIPPPTTLTACLLPLPVPASPSARRFPPSSSSSVTSRCSPTISEGGPNNLFSKKTPQHHRQRPSHRFSSSPLPPHLPTPAPSLLLPPARSPAKSATSTRPTLSANTERTTSASLERTKAAELGCGGCWRRP